MANNMNGTNGGLINDIKSHMNYSIDGLHNLLQNAQSMLKTDFKADQNMKDNNWNVSQQGSPFSGDG